VTRKSPETSGAGSDWLSFAPTPYRIPRDWGSDEEHRRYYHHDLGDHLDHGDEEQLVIELQQTEIALIAASRALDREDWRRRWLQSRRKKIITGIATLRAMKRRS
jgi:hypothetical protein